MVLEQIYQEINTKKQLGKPQVHLFIFGPSMEEVWKEQMLETSAESMKEVEKDNNNAAPVSTNQTKLT